MSLCRRPRQTSSFSLAHCIFFVPPLLVWCYCCQRVLIVFRAQWYSLLFHGAFRVRFCFFSLFLQLCLLAFLLRVRTSEGSLLFSGAFSVFSLFLALLWLALCPLSSRQESVGLRRRRPRRRKERKEASRLSLYVGATKRELHFQCNLCCFCVAATPLVGPFSHDVKFFALSSSPPPVLRPLLQRFSDVTTLRVHIVSCASPLSCPTLPHAKPPLCKSSATYQ